MMTVMPFVLSCCVDELYSYSLLSRIGLLQTERETTSVMSEAETKLEMEI